MSPACPRPRRSAASRRTPASRSRSASDLLSREPLRRPVRSPELADRLEMQLHRRRVPRVVPALEPPPKTLVGGIAKRRPRHARRAPGHESEDLLAHDLVFLPLGVRSGLRLIGIAEPNALWYPRHLRSA